MKNERVGEFNNSYLCLDVGRQYAVFNYAHKFYSLLCQRQGKNLVDFVSLDAKKSLQVKTKSKTKQSQELGEKEKEEEEEEEEENVQCVAKSLRGAQSSPCTGQEDPQS